MSKKYREIIFRAACIFVFMLVVIVDNARSIGFLGKLSNGVLTYGFFAPALFVSALIYCKRYLNIFFVSLYSLCWLVIFFAIKWFYYYIPGLSYGESLMIILDLWWGSLSVIGLVSNFIQHMKKKEKEGFYSFFNKQFEQSDLQLLFLFCLFTLGAVIGKMDANLPFLTGIVFFLLFMTPFHKKERAMVADSLATGIIAAFWLLQLLAFAFRPYCHVRYSGMYVNCNTFAMICAVVVILSLYKLAVWKKNRVLYCCYLVELWMTIALLFMSLSRTAMLCAVCSIIIFVIWKLKEGLKYKDKKERILYSFKIVIRNFIGFLICFLVMFFSVRYIPAVISHPLYFSDEYFKDGAIFYNDSISSEKYIELDEYMNGLLGRVTNLWEKSSSINKTNQINNGTEIIEMELPLDPEYPNNKYYLPENYSGTENRIAVWRSYLDRINLLGHDDSETLVYISPRKTVEHAHNIIIQMIYSYGIITGIVFLIYAVYSVIWGIDKWKKDKYNPVCFLWVNIVLLTLVYGLFDCTWQVGQAIWFLYLFVPVLVLNKGDKEEE